MDFFQRGPNAAEKLQMKVATQLELAMLVRSGDDPFAFPDKLSIACDVADALKKDGVAGW